ncbi:YadA-like family protein [Microvirga lotononidis]|uniref:Autotransporter adhesin n=1 Tax=Microvirga lotononidis TaxID=864069 RepID=I4YRE2_9HYPH|nr:YadA-like family protein [Microvirga lotononidis]EIM26534.1 autotransporter adhesin [Microvirga lotononidis]WQO31218.1 YadA-like family protein [Microvirga lotononidis]
MSLHSPPRFIAALVAAAIAVSGVSPGALAQTAPKVQGSAGCIVKYDISAGQSANCLPSASTPNLEYGVWAGAAEVNNALSNLQNQINNIRNGSGGAEPDLPVTDGSTILGNGTAGSPIRLNPAITNQINNHEARLGSVEAVNAAQNQTIVNHEGRIDAAEQKNREQDNRISEVEYKNDAQDSRLAVVEQKNVQQDNRLTNVENKNAVQDARLDGVEQKNVQQDNRLNSVEAVNDAQNQTLANHETRIGGLETTVASHGTRLDAAETVLADHTALLADHSSRLGTVETKVSSIITTVDQHSTWINNVNAGKGITNFRTNSNGPDAQATGDKTVSVGAGSVASHNNSVALGDGSKTDRDNSVSVGAAGAERQITNVAAGTENTDAANVAQLRALAAALGGGAAVGPGNGQTINGRSAVASVAGATDPGAVLMPTYQVQDREYRNVGGAIAALDDATIKYDRNEDGSKGNRVTLRGGDKSKPVQISNVADGQQDFDAVNLRQLRAAAGGGKTYTDNRMSVMQEYVDRRFSALSGEVAEVRKEARAAAAVGLATGSLRYDPRPGKASVAAGAGHWRGSSAMAIGVGWNSDDGVARYNISASTTDGEWGVAGGMSFTLN